jgi:adenine-specific DNA-methyltransferase
MNINNFDYPKPLELIKLLVGSIYQDKVTILDFFAGSGTTLDATMKLNAEDGGHRQCILVTNNENGICEKVTYVRNKKVIEGYTTPKGEQVAGLTHNNLRYYKTDFVPRERTVKNMRDLVNAATDMLCIKENMYKEQTLFGPWDELPQFIARHFTDGESGEMIIIYDENYIGEIVKAIKTMTFEKPLKVYVFTTDRDPYEDEFDDVLNKVELCALPAAIYDAYVQVIPHPQDKYIKIAVNSNEEDLENWDEDITMEMDLAAEEDHK